MCNKLCVWLCGLFGHKQRIISYEPGGIGPGLYVVRSCRCRKIASFALSRVVPQTPKSWRAKAGAASEMRTATRARKLYFHTPRGLARRLA